MKRRLLAEQGQVERGQAGAQRVAVEAMPGKARRETLHLQRAERLAQTVHHRRGRRVVVDAPGAPVAFELGQVEIVAADLRRPRPEECRRALVVADRRETGRAAETLLCPGGGDV